MATPVVTAELPAEFSVIPGSAATAGPLAYLMVAKYCDHLPFYRLQQIFHRRHRVLIDRGAMCHWMGRCAEVLERLHEAQRKELVSGQYLQIDEWSGAALALLSRPCNDGERHAGALSIFGLVVWVVWLIPFLSAISLGHV